MLDIGENIELKTRRVVASGGVVFRAVNDQFEVALIAKGKRWFLPRGLVESGETIERAALREVREETCLDCEIVKKLGKFSYSFTRGKRYFKTIHFYLLKYTGGSLLNHDSEVDKVKWFPISEALQVLFYKKEKGTLKQAEKMLSMLIAT